MIRDEGQLRVLVVDDEEVMRSTLELRLRGWGYEVILAADADGAVRAAREHDPHLVISDVVLPGASGIELLDLLRNGGPYRPLVLITAHGTIDDAVEAMKRGADDFLTKPLEYDKLRATLEALLARLEERRLTERLEAMLGEQAGPGGMVGTSPAMLEVLAAIGTVAASDATVLLIGESGTGKELAARAIHDLGGHRSGPFVALNAAAIPEGVVESELFGHEKGAFTGAQRAHAGCFERADGGSLFLDEIAEMPVALQPKLLRVLEQRTVRRVGGSREIPFSTRLITATNQDPHEAVAAGRLREDLFYRISVFPIRIPPLRERQTDIPLLAQHFITVFNRKHGMEVAGLADEARQRLVEYDWPGNVRELRNVMERAVILASEGWVQDAHLPPFFRLPVQGSGNGLVVPHDATVEEAERMLILNTLERVGNNKAEAARRLGVDVKTIRNKLKRYSSDPATP